MTSIQLVSQNLVIKQNIFIICIHFHGRCVHIYLIYNLYLILIIIIAYMLHFLTSFKILSSYMKFVENVGYSLAKIPLIFQYLIVQSTQIVNALLNNWYVAIAR